MIKTFNFTENQMIAINIDSTNNFELLLSSTKTRTKLFEKPKEQLEYTLAIYYKNGSTRQYIFTINDKDDAERVEDIFKMLSKND